MPSSLFFLFKAMLKLELFLEKARKGINRYF